MYRAKDIFTTKPWTPIVKLGTNIVMFSSQTLFTILALSEQVNAAFTIVLTLVSAIGFAIITYVIATDERVCEIDYRNKLITVYSNLIDVVGITWKWEDCIPSVYRDEKIVLTKTDGSEELIIFFNRLRETDRREIEGIFSHISSEFGR